MYAIMKEHIDGSDNDSNFTLFGFILFNKRLKTHVNIVS